MVWPNIDRLLVLFVCLKLSQLFLEQRKHPHVIFEARTKVKQMCANTGMLEYGLRSGNYRGGGGGGGKGQSKQPKSNERQKRDVREVTKYVETALVLDKAMVRDYNETIALATLIELNGIYTIFMQLV